MKKTNNTSLKRRHDVFGLVYMIPWFIGFLLFFLPAVTFSAETAS